MQATPDTPSAPEDPDAIVVPIDRTEADLRDAYAWMRWHMRSWYIVMLFCFAGLVAAYSFTRFGAYEGSVVTLLGIGVLYVLYRASLASAAARVSKAYSHYGPTTYTFTQNGFEGRGANTKTTSTWAVVRKVAESKRCYLMLSQGNLSVLVIPKRCIPADKSERFRALLKQSVPDRASLRDK